jgi:hypothetical protein
MCKTNPNSSMSSAHDSKTETIFYRALLAFLPFLIMGCTTPAPKIGLNDLVNPDPAVRIQAIKWAGENKVEQAVPLLVDRLQEQDDSVRFFAIAALRRITGTDHGFDYKADAGSRAQAVQRWREAIGEIPSKTTP